MRNGCTPCEGLNHSIYIYKSTPRQNEKDGVDVVKHFMLEDHVTNTLYAFTAVVNTAVFQGCKSNVLPITAYKIKASQYMSFANTIKKKKKLI